nr:hypothetical protein [Microbacterium sp. NIBRBAC000506063]
MAPLIDATDLAALVAAGRSVRLLDVRWRLDEPEGRPRYLDGHLPAPPMSTWRRSSPAAGTRRRGVTPCPPPRSSRRRPGGGASVATT